MGEMYGWGGNTSKGAAACGLAFAPSRMARTLSRKRLPQLLPFGVKARRPVLRLLPEEAHPRMLIVPAEALQPLPFRCILSRRPTEGPRVATPRFAEQLRQLRR